MAVTAEDQKYLTSSGIAAVQAATDKWNKAQAAGDQAGMSAAKAEAAAARANTTYQMSGSTGYITNDDGSYKAPTTTTTVVNPTSGNVDYAQQIVDMLTSGGAIDYSRLNQLAAAREAKMSTNPDQFKQFESTQSIINRYLPSAQAAEQANKKVTDLESLVNSLKSQIEQKDNTTSDSIDSLSSLIQALTGSSAISTDYTTATNQAKAQLNPQYEEAAKTLKTSLDQDMEQRGIYNSPLASGIYAEKQGSLDNQKAASIAELATTLQQNNNTLSLQEKQDKLSSLNTLLSSLVGREVNLADITGTYNGQPTQAAKEASANFTGVYDGIQTIASKQLEYQQQASKISAALSAVETMGKVTTQEQADLLGVPIGTSSQSAKAAADSLAADLQMFYAELQLKQAQAAASSSASSSSSAAQKFSNAMDVWQATGSAPAGILQDYGVAPGTPYSSEDSRSLQYKAAELEAAAKVDAYNEEQAFQNRVSNFANSYKVSEATAEAAITAISNSADASAAKSIINKNKTALAAEGVSAANANAAIDAYYKNQENVSGRQVGNRG